ncbi:MAG: mechanosensitive ion channel [Deltaproteobacteria bacterium]|nr:mechanosensitive ion channel [Kofleriaceae bacterium]
MAENLIDLLMAGYTVWLVLAWAIVTPLSRFGLPAARQRLRAPTVMVILHVGLVVLVAGIDSAGYDPRASAVAAFAFLLLSFIGLAQVLLFWIALPRVGVRMPRIVVDVVTAIASIIALIAVGKRAGFSVAGLITTSAVLTAVIGFAMQDTLGNLIGGLALQMDSSIRVGDWISLGPNQPAGQVSEIRWRYTAIETRAWETIIVPNSMLMKSQVVVLGRRQGQPEQMRRNVEFHVDFRTPPTEVLEVVRRALAADPVPHMATEPPPHVLFLHVRDSYAVYTVRYWLNDLAIDDPTDSEVRIRIYFALQRAGLTMSIPAQTLFVTADTDERRDRKQREEHERRLAAVGKVDLLEPLSREERSRLADRLQHTPFAAGEAVCREGADDRSLYMLVRGEAAVRIGRGIAAREVARIGPGQFFGEMSLMTGEPRAASVVAVTDLDCYRLDPETFRDLVRARPAITDRIAEILAARREALESVRGQADAARRKRLETAKQDLVGRIRSFFSLPD